MQHPSLNDQIANKCRHFNGIMNDTCEVGISYKSVRDPKLGIPCLKEHDCAERCTSVSFLSPEEVAEKEAEISQFVKTFLTEMAEGKNCPHCHTPIEAREQVGRCIYLQPCGCRLGQGSLSGQIEDE